MTLTELCRSALPISAVASVMKMRASGWRRISTGQRADVIEMRMRNDDRIERAIAERLKVRQGCFAFLLRMHAAIEDEPPAGGLEVVAIGADLGAAREVDEFQSNWANIRIQFPKRIFAICSSLNPRSISL